MTNKLEDSRVIISKTKLLVNQNVIRIHMYFKFGKDYFFENFTTYAK